MTTRTWNGSVGDFSTAVDWSPTGVPVSGDVAVINSGTVSASGTIDGVSIQLSQDETSVASTTFNLNNAMLPSGTSLTLTVPDYNLGQSSPYRSTPIIVNVNGLSTVSDSIAGYGGAAYLGGGADTFQIAAGATLRNTGSISFFGALLGFEGGGTLVNDGKVALLDTPPFTEGVYTRTSFIDVPISGNGTIALGLSASVAIGASVGTGQTLVFNGGAIGNEAFELDALSSFAGTIAGFSMSDGIWIPTAARFTGAIYTSTGVGSGTLHLSFGSTLQGSINFLGAYTLSNFNFSFSGDFNDSRSGLFITTNAINAVNTGLPAGYGETQVFRFFDARDGSHLFTANAAERNALLLTRPDLVQEANGFGTAAVDDPNREAVYRFFDTRNGAHFFTSSTTERDAVIATRPDLIYEPNSTFYEHSSQQAGDVAVYRFFDPRTGTQFLTGSQSEYNNLTTPGSSSYRADLRSEGVAFYAPSGTFT